MKPVKTQYIWIKLEDLLKRVVMPEGRVASLRDKDEEEQLRRSMLEDVEGFFDRSPIILTAADGGKLYLADGGGRLEAAKHLKLDKVRVRVEFYESDADAYNAALDGSYIINVARGRVTAYDKVRYALVLRARGMRADEVAKRMKLDEKTIYHFWKIGENKEVMEKLRRGEITLRDAINMAYREGGSLARETRGKRIATRPAPLLKKRVKAAASAVTGPETGAAEYTKRDVLREVEASLNYLGVTDERDRRGLLRDAERIFGNVEPELAIKAIRIWRSSGGALTYWDALEKAKEGEVVEEGEVELVEGVRCLNCGGVLTCPSCGWPRRGGGK